MSRSGSPIPSSFLSSLEDMSTFDEVIWQNVVDENAKDTKDFVEWIANRGDSTKGVHIGNGGAVKKFRFETIMREEPDPIAAIVEQTYSGILRSPSDPEIFKDRAIVAATNEMVDAINDHVMSLLPAEERIYLSSDITCKENGEIDPDNEVFSLECLSRVKCSGLPNHKIKLKGGCIVMLLKDVDPPNGLFDGTRMMVTKLGDNVVEACLVSGNNAGKKFPISRARMSSSDWTKFPIRFQRMQFPLAVCYAMTMNKSRGQSLSKVGLYVPKSMYSFDEMCIAIFEINSKKGPKVLACDESGKMCFTAQRYVAMARRLR